MSFKELVKLQIVSKKVSQSSLKYLIIFAIAEETFKHVGGFLKDRFRQKVTEVITQVNLVDDAVLLNKRHPMNQVRMRRVWSMKQSDESFIETNMVVDSIIHYIGKLDNIPSLQLIEHAQTLISYLQKHVQITKDIFVKVEKIEKDVESGTITSIILILSSNTLSASDISKWVRQIYMTHKENLRNSLGDSIFFFDHKHITSTLNGGGMDIRGAPEPQLQKSMMLMSAHKSISFTKTTFYSNKNFKNIFGPGVRRVEERVRFFLNHKDWYDSRGIPYQLGLMLSGIPGSGKTSIIRAIANLTHRHIVNVNFANIQTTTQLKNLFFDEKICVGAEMITIPIEQRIYVLEELDAVGNLLAQRVAGDEQKDVLPDELTLGEILTVLDGTQETPGRIIVMTSNHPELLDKALMRPGRVDINERFDYAERQLIVDMYAVFFNEIFPSDLMYRLPDKKFTAAEVSQKLFGHFNKNSTHLEIVQDFALDISRETVSVKKLVLPDYSTDIEGWESGGLASF